MSSNRAIPTYLKDREVKHIIRLLSSGSVTANKTLYYPDLPSHGITIKCTNKLVQRSHIPTVFCKPIASKGSSVHDCTRNGLNHNFEGPRSPNRRNLVGTDQFQDAALKIHSGTSVDAACTSVASPPDFFALFILLPPYKIPGLHWDGKMGFETIVPHLPGCCHLNKTTFFYISTCLSRVLAFRKQQAAGPVFGYRSALVNIVRESLLSTLVENIPLRDKPNCVFLFL